MLLMLTLALALGRLLFGRPLCAMHLPLRRTLRHCLGQEPLALRRALRLQPFGFRRSLHLQPFGLG
jgi:hypothetical protein